MVGGDRDAFYPVETFRRTATGIPNAQLTIYRGISHGGVRAIGIDLDPAMIEIAIERRPTSEFHVGDATALPLDDGSVISGLSRLRHSRRSNTSSGWFWWG